MTKFISLFALFAGLAAAHAHAAYRCTAYTFIHHSPRYTPKHGYGNGSTLEEARYNAVRSCRMRNVVGSSWCRVTSCQVVPTIEGEVAAPADLYGSWSYGMENSRGYSFRSILKISERSTTFTSECGKNGKTTPVSVTVPTEVTDTAFKVLEGASAKDEKDGIRCSIDIVPTEFTYALDGNRLELKTKHGHSVFYGRDL